jgi:hypothetical protein
MEIPLFDKYELFEKLYKQREENNIDMLYLKCVKNYYEAIKDGPCYACACCDQLHFKKRISMLKVEEMNLDWLDVCYLNEELNTVMLCKKCLSYLRRKMISPFAKVHGFEFPEVPPVLAELNCLEERIVSPRIPFMSIRELGVDRQFGLKGGCVNVPVDMNNTVSELPRNVSDSMCIHVQLKRRLTDKHSYLKSNVCPKKIFEAAKFLVKTPVYAKYVTLCEEWLENLGNEICEDEPNIIDNDKGDENFEEEREIIAHPTLLTDDHLPDFGISLAPGEGKTPVSLLFDEDAEELACPKTYVGQKIVINSGASIAQINKALLKIKGRRICRNNTAKMMKFCKERIRKLSSKVQIALKKKKMKGIVTVNDVISLDFVANLVQENVGYKVLQEDRSSPAYWQHKKKTLFAMIRQLGPAHIFMSLSAAESEWSELLIILCKNRYGIDYSEEEVKELSYEQKVDLIQNDSQSCSEYFDHRTRELFKVLKQKNSIFRKHEIKDYFIRVEFQHRGM